MKIKIFFITILCIILLAIIWAKTNERVKIDGIAGELGELILTEDTRYANGYSHIAFNQIQIGMAKQEVLEILGEPLIYWNPYRSTKYTNKSHYIGFQYSESPTSSHYRLRQIYFDNEVVAEIIGYFYVD